MQNNDFYLGVPSILHTTVLISNITNVKQEKIAYIIIES